MHFILSKHVSAQKLDFLSMNVCVHKWASIDTHAHICVWKHMRWGMWVFFETQYLLWCLCISLFFRGTMSCICCFFFFLSFFFGVALPHTHFFYGTYFENYGLGLGLALFRLGVKWVPRWRRILSRKFFQTFRENLGFGLVSNFSLGIIWLGWPSKSQTGWSHGLDPQIQTC